MYNLATRSPERDKPTKFIGCMYIYSYTDMIVSFTLFSIIWCTVICFMMFPKLSWSLKRSQHLGPANWRCCCRVFSLEFDSTSSTFGKLGSLDEKWCKDVEGKQIHFQYVIKNINTMEYFLDISGYLWNTVTLLSNNQLNMAQPCFRDFGRWFIWFYDTNSPIAVRSPFQRSGLFFHDLTQQWPPRSVYVKVTQWEIWP